MIEHIKKKILVVDDTPFQIKTLTSYLKEAYQVIAATSAQKALEILRTGERPALIMLDIVMPDMDGYELCRILKADPAYAEIPIVFLTALGEKKDIIAGVQAGANRYLVKPFNPDKVLEILKELV